MTAIITSTTECPCMAGFHIAGVGSASPQRYVTLDSVTTGGHGRVRTRHWHTHLGRPVATAMDHFFTVRARIFGGTGGMEAYAAITAECVPFGSMGTDLLGGGDEIAEGSLATVKP